MGLGTLISSVFTGAKTAEKAVDVADKVTTGFIAGIDKMFYTQEERAEAIQKYDKLMLDYWGLITKENTQQSMARRELARMAFQVYFFLILAMVILWKVDLEWAKFIFKALGMITWLVGMIAATYFVPHQVSKIWKSPNVTK